MMRGYRIRSGLIFRPGRKILKHPESHQRVRGAAIGLLVVATLWVGLGDVQAQPAFFLRLAPEMGRITVEHTKKVTIQGGSSSSTSSSSGLALAGNLSAGLRLKLPGNWLVGGEVEGVFSSRRKLEGTISPTPNGNVHDVWPGRWDFSDLAGAGGNIIFGRGLETATRRSICSEECVERGPSSLPERRIPRPECSVKTASASEDGRGRSARERHYA